MASVNKAIILGNVGKDPDIRKTGDGNTIANLSIATTERWTDKNGEKKERTEWHRVSIFGKLATVVEQYVKKGDALYVEGKIQTRKWTDSENQDRYTTEIILDFDGKLQMLGSNKTESVPLQKPAIESAAQPFNDEIPF